MNIRSIVALILCCFAMTPTWAQERYAQQLHLKTGTYDCPENVDEFLNAPFRADELRDGAYYRILQFSKLPTPEERRAMASAGIELRTYIPSNAFHARIQSNALLDGLTDWGVRSVLEWDPRFKMTTALANEEFPEHAINGRDRILLSVIYQPDFSASEVISRLQANGTEIIGRFTERNQIEISASLDHWRGIAAMPEVYFVEAIDPTPTPENDRSRTNHRVNFYQNGSTQYGGFDGSGVVVAMGDDGEIGPHIDYQGRVDQRYADASSGNHGDHVAGIIFGAGNYDPDGRGNAPGAFLFAYEPFDNVDSSDSHYNLHQVRITSTSYGNGCNAGYTSYASFADETIYDNPGLMHVFSAGNSGTSNCGYGAGSGWGNITGGIKVGKNTLAVGNVQYTDVIATSSSRGPADDGRIKPDICAVGSSVYSTVDVNSYASFTGTSMAAPGIAGALATMYQAYKETNSGSEPHSALMKGILMNTAEDLGNPGPDFTYGYGRVNARRAQEAIVNSTFFVDSMSQGGSDTYTVTVPAGMGELKIMLYWNDVEGSPFASTPLVNDLKLVVDDPNGTSYDPWVLDDTPNASLLNADAVRGVDNMNNVEQVTLDNPVSGDYIINVSGPSVPNGPQHYVVVYQFVPADEIVLIYPNGGSALLPNSTEVVRWDALDNGTGFTLDYSDDNGVTWNTIGTAGASALHRNWSVPSSLASDEVLVRVSRGTDSDQSDSVNTALRRVGNFQVQSVCPDSIYFTWNAVTGASSYEIMRLDSAYMQVVATATGTGGAVLQHNPSVDHYYSIRAVGANGGKGERRDAVFVPAGLQNCVLDNDMELTMVSPFSGPLPGCTDTSSAEVVVQVANIGSNDIYGFNLTYIMNGGTPIVENWTDTLVSGASEVVTFSQTTAPSGSSMNALVVYSSMGSDQNNYNDTAKADFYYLGSSTSSSTPWMDNLESFTPCGTTSNCGATVCSLNGGWVNLMNGVDDDIDWRTNFGGTPSNNTGPSQDFNPGNANGKYIYLEASNGCNGQTALLYSPCIDIPASGSFELTYRYHMDGADQGELHTDLIVDGRLILDVIPPVFGDQGGSWNLASVNMTPYAGETVVIRMRGITGPDFESDMALDDFKVQAPTNAPVAGFNVSSFAGCPGTVIDFTNTSSGAPNAFAWYVSPSTGWSFVNGTSASSENASIQFNTTGTYTVGMTADNGVGLDSIGISQSIEIGGLQLPFFEDFEGVNGFGRFELTNPDGDITWERSSVSGNGGSWAAGINNYSYSAAQLSEVQDWLTTPILDFTGAVNPRLTFDHAYANYSVSLYDSMSVFISTDCGVTWTRLASYDGSNGGNLLTAGTQNGSFTPSTSSDWCATGSCTDIDLAAYVGFTDVQIRFIAKSGYGNNLYIDNINIGQPLPAASITASATAACTGEVVTFSDGSGGAFQNYNWDFGSGANPATATGPGPHSVTYSNGGNKNVTLLADNGGGSAGANVSVQITAPETAQFTVANQSVGVANFTPQANQSNVDSVMWDFGDGNTSTFFAPTHTYTANGTYTVGLTVYSACGMEYVSTNVLIQGIGLEELSDGQFALFPQPTADQVNLNYRGGDLQGSVTIRFVDGLGRVVLEEAIDVSELSSGKTWSIASWAAGTYFLQVQGEKHFWQTPLIKQ